MFQVRKMEPEDFPFALSLANTMNWNMTADDFAFNLQLEPNGCLLLVKDKEPLGLATCISYGKVGWFGNLIIQETYRKQGAGTQLVNHAVTYLKRKGATSIGLYGYPHLTNFYAKFGFKSDVDFTVLKAPAVCKTAPISKEDIKPIEKKQINDILSFDERYFGSCRQKVLKPILQNPTNLCFAAWKNNQVTGIIAVKVFDEAAEIGPLVCMPDQNATAAKLLQTALANLDGKEAYLYVRASEAALLDVANHAGFTKTFQLVRMFLGAVTPQDGVYVAESLERG